MRSTLPFLRDHRGFAALMLLILASTPILDGGCFTYRQISANREERWDDLHAPCAAYMGGDGSLTLILPDGEDLKKAKFFAARFTAEEVKVATKVAEETRVTPEGKRYYDITVDGLPTETLQLRPLRKDPRMAMLTGTTESEWLTALPANAHGGYWLHAKTPAFTSSTRGFQDYGFAPTYVESFWEIHSQSPAGGRMEVHIALDGGTHMRPTAGVLLVPVTLVVDVVTSPIQLVAVVVVGVGAATSK